MPDTTPVFGFPYPEATDPPDGPGALEDLANAVEDVLAPSGLTSGQGLVWDGTTWVATDIATQAELAADIATHAAAATAVHGIADSAKLLVSPESGLKLLRGVVTNTGAISEGSGFTVAKTATGKYTITFSPAFSDVPVVLANPVEDDTRTATVYDAATGSVKVDIRFSTDNTHDNIGFHFIAIGPA